MSTLKTYLILIITSFFFFYSFALDTIFNALSPYLLENYQFSPTALGFISSLYFYGNIIFLIPAGLILDRFNIKIVLPTVVIVAASLNLVMAFCINSWSLGIIRFLIGICAAFSFTGSVKMAVSLVRVESLSKAIGIIATMGLLGGLVSQAPFTYLLQQTSWTASLSMMSVMGYVIAILIGLTIKDIAVISTLSLPSITGNSLKKIFLNAQNVLCATYASLINLPIFMLGAMWGVPYLMSVGHYSALESAYISGMLFIGFIIGSMAIGFLENVFQSKRRLMIMGASLSFIIMLIIVSVSPHYYRDLALFLGLGITISSQILSFSQVVNNNPPALAARASSIVCIISLLGGAIIQPLFGFLLTKFSVNNLITAYSYSMAIKGLLITFIVALIISLFIKET